MIRHTISFRLHKSGLLLPLFDLHNSSFESQKSFPEISTTFVTVTMSSNPNKENNEEKE